jgi:integrase
MKVDIKDHGSKLEETTKRARNGQLSRISILFGGDGETLDTNVFNDGMVETLKTFFQEHNYSDCTCKHYLDTLLVFGKAHNVNFNIYAQLLRWRESIHPESSIKPQEDYLLRLETALKNQSYIDSKNLNVCRVVNIVLLVGPIRLGDLVNTRLSDKPDLHFLDLKSKTWYIRAKSTKNRMDRKFSVSDEFVEWVKRTYPPNYDYLIYNYRNDKPSTANALGLAITKYLGINYATIRKSYIDHHDHGNFMDEVVAQANRLGHTVKTETLKYTVPPETENSS